MPVDTYQDQVERASHRKIIVRKDSASLTMQLGRHYDVDSGPFLCQRFALFLEIFWSERALNSIAV